MDSDPGLFCNASRSWAFVRSKRLANCRISTAMAEPLSSLKKGSLEISRVTKARRPDGSGPAHHKGSGDLTDDITLTTVLPRYRLGPLKSQPTPRRSR